MLALGRRRRPHPVAKTVEYSVKPAARLQAIDGATIGLYWNIKAGGDAALDKTEELLRARFPKARFKRYTGSVAIQASPRAGARRRQNRSFAPAMNTHCPSRQRKLRYGEREGWEEPRGFGTAPVSR